MHHLVRTLVPLRVHVLDIDLDACVTVRALKGATTAVGRTATSDLLRAVPAADVPLAAVNADFFLFTPPGVPVGALVQDGRVIAGPIDRPVLAFDVNGRGSIGRLAVIGSITSERGRVTITSWNRPSAKTVGVVDAAWGQVLDSLTRTGALRLAPLGAHRYRVETLTLSSVALARGDTMMLVGSDQATIREHDTVTVDIALRPGMPANAVGGYPTLVSDGLVVPSVDSLGAVSFRGVNPRTAVGLAANGRRLLLVVIDGRQDGHSVGTTTRETAELLRDLGAREALNLDGGGSSAMVVRDAASGLVHLVNKPSDAAGERPVADALAVLGVCQKRPS